MTTEPDKTIADRIVELERRIGRLEKESLGRRIAPDKLVCPHCEEMGVKSFVYIGYGTTTLLGWQPYYDLDGNLHDDNPNRTTMNYSCSNGHEFTKMTDAI